LRIERGIDVETIAIWKDAATGRHRASLREGHPKMKQVVSWASKVLARHPLQHGYNIYLLRAREWLLVGSGIYSIYSSGYKANVAISWQHHSFVMCFVINCVRFLLTITLLRVCLCSMFTLASPPRSHIAVHEERFNLDAIVITLNRAPLDW
jgi:hypothetical protein